MMPDLVESKIFGGIQLALQYPVDDIHKWSGLFLHIFNQRPLSCNLTHLNTYLSNLC